MVQWPEKQPSLEDFCTVPRYGFSGRAKDFYIGINTMKHCFTNLCTSFTNNDYELSVEPSVVIASTTRYRGAGLSKIIMEVPSPLLLLALAMSSKVHQKERAIKLPFQDGNNVMSNKDFRVLGIHTKTYNKWFPCQKGRQPWHQTQAEGKYRIYARMIEFHHSLGAFINTQTQPTPIGASRASMFCVMLLT
jgi:hypothetical protein